MAASRLLLGLCLVGSWMSAVPTRGEEPTEFLPQSKTIPFVSQYAWCSAFSQDGRWLVTGYGHWQAAGEARVWDLSTGKIRHQFDEPRGVRTVRFFADGRTLATGNFAGDLKIRDLETGQVRQTLKVEGGSVDGMALSADNAL